MTSGSDRPADSSALPLPPPATPPDGFWTTTLTDDCLDDVTLPPGGISAAAKTQTSEKQHFIHWPDYLSHEGRDLRIDLLRGYFVFAMIIDHVRGQSPLYLLTGGNRFYTSAAEGFILTSGLVAGLVYRRLIQKKGFAASVFKVLSRAATLYLLTIGVTLLFTVFSEVVKLPWAQGLDLSDPLGFVVSVLTLHRTYYLIDVMLLYTVLFLVSPLAFILLDRGKTWLLLLASGLLYLAYQFYPQYASLPWDIAGNYLFNFSAWQVLFFGGLILGFHNEKLPTLSRCGTRNALIATGIGTLVLIGLYFLIDTPTSIMPPEIAATSPVIQDARLWLQDNIFAKVDLRPGRLLTSAVTFSFMFFLVTFFWSRVQRIIGWLFIPLGQFALNSYTLHIALATLVALALAPFNLDYPGPQWLNAFIQTSSVLLIWFLVKRQFLVPTSRTMRWWKASPAVIAVGLILVLASFPTPTLPGLAAAVAPDTAGQVRVPRRYGSPVPPTPVGTPVPSAKDSTAAAAAAGEAAFIPESARAVRTIPGTDMVVSDYLGPLYGQLREREFYSAELNRVMPYYIYFPPDYDAADRRYPVLYMLHGLGGHREEWVVYGLIDTADGEIHNGNVPPMIIILPQGDKGYWLNHADDGPRWGEYLVRDLIPHIDANYRTLRARNSRAMGGLSMGGWAALTHAFQHPELIGIAGAHSPSLRPEDGKLAFLGAGDVYKSKDPVTLARTAAGIQSLQIWVDIGESDEWLYRTAELHLALLDRGITHIWQIHPGGHDYEYWTEHVIDYVRFYGAAFSKQ